MKVRFTPRAERHIDALYDYIASRSSDPVAETYVNRIVSFCGKLSDFPQRGSRHDEILPGLRTIGFERRVTIAFLVIGQAVLIEGIFYGGQDFGRALKPKLDD